MNTRSRVVQVRKVSAVDGGIIELAQLLVDLRDDPALANTNITAVGSVVEAEQWILSRDWVACWLVTVDGCPCGVIALHPPFLFEDAEPYRDHLEVEIMIVDGFRGTHVGGDGLSAVMGELPSGTSLVGEIWSTNLPSIRMVQRLGWAHVGRVWWTDPTRPGDPDDSGWCERFVYVV